MRLLKLEEAILRVLGWLRQPHSGSRGGGADGLGAALPPPVALRVLQALSSFSDLEVACAAAPRQLSTSSAERADPFSVRHAFSPG